MYPLIEIRSVPIELEFKVTNASLEHAHATAEMEISRDKGGLQIKSRPIRLNMDTFDARNSIIPTSATTMKQYAEKGVQASYEATASYAREGALLLQTQIGEELVTQFSKESMSKGVMENVGIEFLPSAPVKMDWEPGSLSIRYEMDKLNFDWKFGGGNFEFTPGDIQISVKQYPDVLIKYVGGPLYVPPSSDPNYVPLDSEA